jgi:curved DNA-binding protein CbpA
MTTAVIERDLYKRLNVDPSADSHAVRSAYRLLAHRIHPDRNDSPAAHDAMVQLNHAYAILRDPARRAAYDQERSGPEPVSKPRPSGRDASGRVVLDFGRYEGYALQDIARHDPEYLEWLKRHSSGPRYRHEIDRVLDALGRAPMMRTQTTAGARRR